MATNVGGLQLVIDASQIETKLIQVLEKARKSMPEFIDMIVTQMGDAVIDYAIPLTRVRTGRLISSYKMSEITHSGNTTGLVVYNYASEDGKTSYAMFNEYGTIYMAPRLMLTTAKEKVLVEGNQQILTALIRLVRGDASGRYTFKFN